MSPSEENKIISEFPGTITVASTGWAGTSILGKLFSLGYKPTQIRACAPSANDIFALYCRESGINIVAVSNNNDIKKSQQYLNSDILLCASGLPFLLDSASISIFKHGGINLHTGLSQFSRGRWQSSWAIINNQEYSGFTWHKIDNNFDTGNILVQQKIKIEIWDTAFSLNQRIFTEAIAAIPLLLTMIEDQGAPLEHHGKYYNKITPFDGLIDSTWDIETVDRFIRALYHPPHRSAMTKVAGRMIEVNNIDEYVKLHGL